MARILTESWLFEKQTSLDELGVILWTLIFCIYLILSPGWIYKLYKAMKQKNTIVKIFYWDWLVLLSLRVVYFADVWADYPIRVYFLLLTIPSTWPIFTSATLTSYMWIRIWLESKSICSSGHSILATKS